VVSVYFILPIVPAGVPFSAGFTWSAVNYAFLAVGGAILLAAYSAFAVVAYLSGDG